MREQASMCTVEEELSENDTSGQPICSKRLALITTAGELDSFAFRRLPCMWSPSTVDPTSAPTLPKLRSTIYTQLQQHGGHGNSTVVMATVRWSWRKYGGHAKNEYIMCLCMTTVQNTPCIFHK
jgi:hypothetical protein